MLKVLVCTSKKEHFQVMKGYINDVQQSEILFAQHKDEVGKKLVSYAVDVCIIDLPFTQDRHEIDFLLSLQDKYKEMAFIVLLSQKHVHQFQEKIEKFGFFIIPKPFQREMFRQILSFIRAYSYQLNIYKQNQKSLLAKINEIKLINLAKCLLMENEYMSENKAHYYIEKEAMDNRKNKQIIAKEIIARYQNI